MSAGTRRASTRSTRATTTASSSSSNDKAQEAAPAFPPSPASTPRRGTKRGRQDSDPSAATKSGKAAHTPTRSSARQAGSEPSVQLPPTPEPTPKRRVREADPEPPATPTKRHARVNIQRKPKTISPSKKEAVQTEPAVAAVSVPEPTLEVDVAAPVVELPALELDLGPIKHSAKTLGLLQQSIVSKLRGCDALLDAADQSAYLPCLESHERDVRNTLQRTVAEDEGNCTLLVGPRGVGKSTLVERSLDVLRARHGANGFLLVRLNGLVHNTDRLALRDIARQLCATHQLQQTAGAEDDTASFTSHANTLASLLAILEPSGSAASASTSSAPAHSKPIIFVLDEFDLFALRDARQSFLYCLLDIVQSHRRGGGMAVLGLSSRMDCLSMLEKRLKSRCQNRLLHVFACQSRVQEVAKAGLTVRPESLAKLAGDEGCSEKDCEALAREWNGIGVQNVLSSPSVKNALDHKTSMSANKADLFSVLDHHISGMCIPGESEFYLSELSFRPRSAPSGSRIKRVLAGLSPAELAVLISLKHVKTEEDTVNLTMAYLSYRNHLKRLDRASKGLSHTSFAKAFEQLKTMGILIEHQTNGSIASMARGNTALWRMVKLVPWMQHIDEAVANSASCPESLKRFCKSPDA